MTLDFMIANAAWFVGLFFAALLGAELQKQFAILRWRRRNGRDGRRSQTGPAPAYSDNREPEFDSAQQLREVERSAFSKRKLLNTGENRLMTLIETTIAELAPRWRVMAQVSLGEILSSPSKPAYRAINSKRVDLLLVDADGYPLHAVELQGRGHHIGPAAVRDAIKKEALRRAGVGYIEVVSGETPAEVRAKIMRLIPRATRAGN